MKANQRTGIDWYVVAPWIDCVIVWVLIVFGILSLVSCTKTHPAFTEYNPDSLYCCPPIDAPEITAARRSLNVLTLYGDYREPVATIDLKTGESDYIVADCSGFKWDCKEWPIRFYRNVKKGYCEEYVVYFGRKIFVNEEKLREHQIDAVVDQYRANVDSINKLYDKETNRR